MKKYYSFIFLITFLTLKTTISFSQSGFLDASFGTGGKVVTQTGDSSSVANAVVITSAGKILAGGYSFIAGRKKATLVQYNSDGTLDSTFGLGGEALIPGFYQSSIASMVLQPDGKILVGGYFYPYRISFLVARFNKNGSLDSTFGSNGIAPVLHLSSDTTAFLAANKITIKPDGKIVAGGVASFASFTNSPVLAQYLPNGNIDSSFGSAGSLTYFIYLPGVFTDAVTDIATAAYGKMLAITHQTLYDPVRSDFLISRFLPDGSFDSAFGLNGTVRTDINDTSGDDGESIVLLPDSSFIVTGTSYAGFPIYQTSIALAKYHSDGSLDSTFGMNGKVLTSIVGSNVYSTHIVLSQNGSLIVSGYTYSPAQDFVLAKYGSNGTLDSSFGTNGITTTDFSDNGDISYSSALQPDGKIVLAGSTGSNTNYNIALARYNNDIILPLHLLSFTATKNETVNLLQWQTAQEMNTSAFEVQRSSNGKEYSTIGYVNAGNNPYHFTDDEPLAGSNYYRLKMIDRSGTFTYGPVRIISNSHSLIVKVYPNPAKSYLQVQISNDKVTTLQWQVISAGGKVLLANQWLAQAGSSVKSINISLLAKGSYYLSVTAKSKKKSLVKFEKL